MRTFWRARGQPRGGQRSAAEALLHGFAERYPDSIFVDQAPELEANVLLAMNDAAGAQRVLAAAADTAAADRPATSLRRARWLSAGTDAGGGRHLQAGCCWAIR